MNINERRVNSAQLLSIILIVVFYALFFTQKIDLTCGSDLARHIKNGELILKTFSPLHTNLYSYTEPDFPIICHHWASNVLYYILWKWVGFDGLVVTNVLFKLLAIFFLLWAALKDSDILTAVIFSILCFPLIVIRAETRPETFSYFFLSVFYFILRRVSDEKMGPRALFILPILQIIWVNMHFYFFIGPSMIFFFLIGSMLNQKNSITKHLAPVLWASILACFLNPYGLLGALVPFSFFKGFAFEVQELRKLLNSRNDFDWYFAGYFEIMFLFTVVSAAIHIANKKFKKHVTPLLLIAFFGTMPFLVARSLTLFGFIFLPTGASIGFDAVKNSSSFLRKCFTLSLLLLSSIVLAMGLIVLSDLCSDNSRFGLGLRPGVNRSADFFKMNHLRGPIFNDYNIGAYLIYHLFPEERVFIDNRPQEYSADFFKKIYIPMLRDEGVWRSMVARYAFNVIYFQVNDGRWNEVPFLERRMRDPDWKLVFHDRYSVILLKRHAGL